MQLIKYEPRPYQRLATDFIIENRRVALFLGMGLGKTVSTLMAITKLMFEEAEICSVLIVATLRVAKSVWSKEALKWEQFEHLTFSKLLGTLPERKKALDTKADIHIINYDQLPWLCEEFPEGLPYDMVVLDESSRMKSSTSKRWKWFKKVSLNIRNVVLLTGTPAPQGYADLWAQIYLLDRGARLGRTITEFYRTYFFTERMYGGWTKRTMKPGADKHIMNAISDICLSISREDAKLGLPPFIEQPVHIDMSPAVAKQYKIFERDRVLEVASSELTAGSAATLVNKLLQFSNGAVYKEDGSYEVIHDAKIKALIEIIEDNPNEAILVAYQYKSDCERLLKALAPYKVRLLKTEEDEDDWNAGKIKVAIAHPASVGHGLNLQFGGHTAIWFGLTWNLELFEQFNMRLYRPGQTETVVTYYLLCSNTEDARVLDVLRQKGTVQTKIVDYVQKKIADLSLAR